MSIFACREHTVVESALDAYVAVSLLTRIVVLGKEAIQMAYTAAKEKNVHIQLE